MLFISKSLGTENICELIRYCLNVGNPCKQAEKAASNVLLHMGFQANLKGYRYIIEIISAVIENPELIYSFIQKLYPIVAKKHGVTPISVEQLVRHSIELTNLPMTEITGISRIFRLSSLEADQYGVYIILCRKNQD